MLVYTEPTVADDSKMKDSGVDAEALIYSGDMTGTYTECTSGIYTMLQVTSTVIPPLLLCVFQVVGSDYYCSQSPKCSTLRDIYVLIILMSVF